MGNIFAMGICIWHPTWRETYPQLNQSIQADPRFATSFLPYYILPTLPATRKRKSSNIKRNGYLILFSLDDILISNTQRDVIASAHAAVVSSAICSVLTLTYYHKHVAMGLVWSHLAS